MSEILQVNQIAERLGLQAPWKMLDFARKDDETHFTGFKNFTSNEAFFAGHFPVDDRVNRKFGVRQQFARALVHLYEGQLRLLIAVVDDDADAVVRVMYKEFLRLGLRV